MRVREYNDSYFVCCSPVLLLFLLRRLAGKRLCCRIQFFILANNCIKKIGENQMLINERDTKMMLELIS